MNPNPSARTALRATQVPTREALMSLPVDRRLRLARRVLPLALLVLVAVVLVLFVVNDALEWPVVAQYLFNPIILSGLGTTIMLSILAMIFGLLLACVVAGMRLSDSVILSGLGGAFVWFFRGVPLLVLLVLTFNIGLMYPTLSLGVPFMEPFWSAQTSDLISPTVCAVLAFSLYEAAYGSEVVRSSLMSVPSGQREAGIAMGMTSAKVFRRVVFPQGMRVATPLLANQFIQMTKNTSIVAYVAVPDLVYSAQSIYSRTFQIIPLLLVVTIWYLVLVGVLTIGQAYLERRFGAHVRTPRGAIPTSHRKADA